jgi:hypothetical protein
MRFGLTFQKYNSAILKEGECDMPDPSSLIKLLASHGYHVSTYHEIPENTNDIIHVEVGKGDPNEIEQSGEIC